MDRPNEYKIKQNIECLLKKYEAELNAQYVDTHTIEFQYIEDVCIEIESKEEKEAREVLEELNIKYDGRFVFDYKDDKKDK